MSHPIPLVRDMELVRGLLQYIAATGAAMVPQPSNNPNYSSQLISYRLKIMHERGLFNGTMYDNGTWGLETLTWEGQDFLGAAQDDTVWERTKARAGKHFGSLSLGIVKGLLLKTASQVVELE